GDQVTHLSPVPCGFAADAARACRVRFLCRRAPRGSRGPGGKLAARTDAAYWHQTIASGPTGRHAHRFSAVARYFFAFPGSFTASKVANSTLYSSPSAFSTRRT